MSTVVEKQVNHGETDSRPANPGTTRLAFKLLVLAASFLVAIGLAELTLAVAKPQMTWDRLLAGRAKHFSLLDVFESCDYLPFRLKPNSQGWIEGSEFRQLWKINSHGMREAELPLVKQPGEFRILTLGDSFTVGHGVEELDCWPRHLERLLQEEVSKSVRVVNAGYACGHAPDCYYAYLAKNIDHLAPDIIVVGLFAGNDSYEPIDHFWAEVDDNGLPLRVLSLSRYVDATGKRRMMKSARPLAYQFPILRNSHLWVLAAQTLTPPLANQEGFHSPHRTTYDPGMEMAYQRSVDCLKGIADLAMQRNIPVVAAVIPADYQIDSNLCSWVHLDADFDINLPQSRWETDLANTEGLTWLDLRQPLKEAWQQTNSIADLYYPADRHFTPLGQEVAAKAIRDVIVELLYPFLLSQTPRSK